MVFEPPCTELYARWCERSVGKLITCLLLDFQKLFINTACARLSKRSIIDVSLEFPRFEEKISIFTFTRAALPAGAGRSSMAVEMRRL